jgi:hypothetical protein
MATMMRTMHVGFDDVAHIAKLVKRAPRNRFSEEFVAG